MAKRPHDGQQHDAMPRKKRIVACEQPRPQHIEPASQSTGLPGGQLLRSITAALHIAGFDSAKPSALEMFRAQTEEYMLRFAKEVKVSMTGQRRTTPVAQDFAWALSRTSNTRAARVLAPQLDLKLPEAISCPEIGEPLPETPAMPDFSSILRPLIDSSPPRWIPKHFPGLPSQHSWKSTDVWPIREKDARRMREKATEEGMLAEQALRKLAQAAKVNALQGASQKRNALAGVGKPRAVRRDNDDMLGSILKDLGNGAAGDSQLDSAGESNDEPLELSRSVLVDSEAAHWRGGRRQGIAS